MFNIIFAERDFVPTQKGRNLGFFAYQRLLENMGLIEKSSVTAYLEGGSYTQSLIYLVVYSNGEIYNVYNHYYDVDSVPEGGSVSAGCNKKISRVDVNFGGGCGS